MRLEQYILDAPSFAVSLTQAWSELHPLVDRPHAVEGSRMRHSWAAKCQRQQQYMAMGLPVTEPLGLPTRWVFRLGQLIHEDWQAALTQAFPDMVELELGLPNPDVQGSCSLDGVITTDLGSLAIEIKSINGFGYKAAVGALNKPAEGPRHDALVQLAMNAGAVPNCLGGVLILVATEAVSVALATRHNIPDANRVLSVWTYTMDQLKPLKDRETRRMNNVLSCIDAGTMAPRQISSPDIPEDARITDPATGAWELRENGQVLDLNLTWHCAYCSYRSQCIEDGDAQAGDVTPRDKAFNVTTAGGARIASRVSLFIAIDKAREATSRGYPCWIRPAPAHHLSPLVRCFEINGIFGARVTDDTERSQPLLNQINAILKENHAT